MTQKTHLDQVIFTKTKKYGCFMTVFYLINNRFYLIYDRLVTDIVNINKICQPVIYLYIKWLHRNSDRMTNKIKKKST